MRPFLIHTDAASDVAVIMALSATGVSAAAAIARMFRICEDIPSGHAGMSQATVGKWVNNLANSRSL